MPDSQMRLRAGKEDKGKVNWIFVVNHFFSLITGYIWSGMRHKSVAKRNCVNQGQMKHRQLTVKCFLKMVKSGDREWGQAKPDSRWWSLSKLERFGCGLSREVVSSARPRLSHFVLISFPLHCCALLFGSKRAIKGTVQATSCGRVCAFIYCQHSLSFSSFLSLCLFRSFCLLSFIFIWRCN